MARQKNSVDKYWSEVYTINSYAIFMGYLLMGVRGLGLLVLTWTTVVLLGGFVSMLQKKDFWCLTGITLVQTAGVFDFLSKEKASDVANSMKGLLFATMAAVVRPFKNDKPVPSEIKGDKKLLVTLVVLAYCVVAVVQLLVLAIVLCPLVVLYVFGLYVSATVSLWRLIQQDYSNNADDGGVNLKPALNVLYSLAVSQGVLYGYRNIYDLAARTGLAEIVAAHYSLEPDLVSEYLEEVMTGCMKDPLFAKGRNLVTYAVDLLTESKLRHGHLPGVRILGQIIQLRPPLLDEGRIALIDHLLTGSASFSQVMKLLLETFGSRSPYSTEIRMHAARIVLHIAGSIRLEQLPRGTIQCISSVLQTFEEYSWRPEGYDQLDSGIGMLPKEYERDWLLEEHERGRLPGRPGTADSMSPERESSINSFQSYIVLVVHGLRILQKLATNEYNFGVISNTEGLISKAIAPLISDKHKLHNDHHDEWSIVAVESLEFMKQLMAIPVGTQAKFRSEISDNSQAIICTLDAILECHKYCQVLLKIQAVKVLLGLPVDTHTPPSVMPGVRSRTLFEWILLDIFLLPDYSNTGRMCGSTHLAKKDSYIARLAGEMLHARMRSVGDVIGDLAKAAAVADAESNAYIRIHAAGILLHLVRYYMKDGEHLQELKNAMTQVMPEVLKQIVCWLPRQEIPAVTEANNSSRIPAASMDLEQGCISHDDDNRQERSSTSHQQKGDQHEGVKPQEALTYLCLQIRITWIDKDKDLTSKFNKIAADICSELAIPCKTFETLAMEFEKLLEQKRVSGCTS